MKYPANTVTAQVYAKYFESTGGSGNLSGFAAALLSAFGLPTPAGGEVGTAAAALQDYGAFIAGGGNSGTSGWPKGWLNMLVFDKDFNLVDLAFEQLDEAYMQPIGNPNKLPMQQLSVTKTIKEPGYVYIYLSNEGNVQQDIYFDDLTITHEKSRVVQADDYYPFGLAFNSYSRENSVPQNFKFNGKEEQTELSLGWLDYGARMYMPEIGRWGVVDPLAEKYRRWSPYNYCIDNPLRFVDPDGMKVEFANDESKTRKENRQDRREFMKSQRELNRKSETARDNWKALKKSDNVHTVHVNQKGADGKVIDNKVNPKEGYSQKTGGGTDIYINTKSTTIEGKDLGTNIIGIAHEEGHATRFDQGLVAEQTQQDILNDPKAFVKGVMELDKIRVTEEVEASKIENKVRSEVGLPARQKYSNIPQHVDPVTQQIKVFTIDAEIE